MSAAPWCPVLATSLLILATFVPPVPRRAAAQEPVPDATATPGATLGDTVRVERAARARVERAAGARVEQDVARGERAPVARGERAPVARVVLGTALGGAAFGAPGLAVMLVPCDEFICGTQLMGATMAATGYVVGSAYGARLAATVHGARPPMGRILLASLLGAAAGGVLWNRIGEASEPRYPGVTDYSGWQLGAAVGVALHVAVTSIVALRAPLVPPPPLPAPPPVSTAPAR